MIVTCRAKKRKSKIQHTTIMKLSKFLFAFIAFIAFGAAQAQLKNTERLPLPDWGVAGQDNATYYYIPAGETYYDVRNQQYVYLRDGKWVNYKSMPTAYQDYDLYKGYKVVITEDKEPYAGFYNLKSKYPKTYQGQLQAPIKPRN